MMTKYSINRRNTWHPKLTNDAICKAVEQHMRSLDDPGFCIACGMEVNGCEPDARYYKCESCGEHEVYGAEELLLHIG